MAEALDWRKFRNEQARRLERRTGQDLAAWNARVQAAGLQDAQALKDWLAGQGVSGYLEQLLRWERFGYPDFMTATAGELIDAQYADRPALRPIYEAIVQAALGLGDVAVQARKTYVSLLTPRRTFARIQATTRARIDLGLRLQGVGPGGRLRPGRIHETMPVQVAFQSVDQVDDEAVAWLARAYAESA